MHPGIHAAERPEHLAVVMAATGDELTYSELDARSNRLAHLLRTRGLRRGDHMAVLLENHARYYEVVWAALRAGLYVTPINWHLGVDEAGYIIEDCGAECFITSARFASLATELAPRLGAIHLRLSIDDGIDGFEDFEAAVADCPATPIDDESQGAIMFYSSGTTGRPKGIKPPLSDEPFGTGTGMDMLERALYGFTEESRYLVPAPLYHAAPLVWSVAAQRVGSTIVVMDHFDAEGTLETIERYRVTHAQFVPTHFVRMLKLDEAARTRHDLSSLQLAVHAAAPCPVEVKQQMLAWWGPIVWEYYAGSEGNGYCSASPQQWLEHPGTVGKMFAGQMHVLDDEGDELAPGEVGQVWFDNGVVFEYHNDPGKTSGAFNAAGWSTLGDVGYVDEDGYLYLTDRISHMIISGGVNVYPQEVENLLVQHPDVIDVAVIGVPDEDLGEAVKAVVHLAPGVPADDATAAALIEHCRAHLAHFKCPRSVDFVDEVPRLPSGKLMKRRLVDRYRSEP